MKMKIKQRQNQFGPNDTIQFDKNKILTRNMAKQVGKEVKRNFLQDPNKKMAQAAIKAKPNQSLVSAVQPYEKQIVQRIAYLEEHQPGFKISHNYVKYHRSFNVKVRVFLVKYIYKICIRYRLKRTTLFLAVFYLDKFLEDDHTADDATMLYAVQAALLIAMKYQEIYPPQLMDWAGSKNKPRILQMEAQMLRKLEFKLAHFTLQHCYQYQVHQRQELKNEGIANTVMHILDLTLFDEKMYQFKPSVLVKHILGLVLKEKGLLCSKELSTFDQKIISNVKWMLERNTTTFIWLEQHRLSRGVGFLSEKNPQQGVTSSIR